MCGKFSQMYSWSEIVEFSDLPQDRKAHDANDREETFTPMREPRVIRLNEAGRRKMVPMRWGWPDRWSSVPMGRPKHIHARAETIDRLRTFASGFAKRRGILPVKTFNVGEEVGKKVVQHVLTPRDGKPRGIAVIFDHVLGPEDERILAFVMVTTPASALIGTVTDRMPAILPPEQWGTWLGETDASPAEIKALLVPYEGELNMTLQPKASPRPPPRPSGQGLPL